MVNDILNDLRLALVDRNALVRHNRVRADALRIKPGKQSLLLGGVGVRLLDVRDGDFAVRVDNFEVALVDERLDVMLDVVDVAVDNAVALDLLDLVDVPALVCGEGTSSALAVLHLWLNDESGEGERSPKDEQSQRHGTRQAISKREDSRTTGWRYLGRQHSFVSSIQSEKRKEEASALVVVFRSPRLLLRQDRVRLRLSVVVAGRESVLLDVGLALGRLDAVRDGDGNALREDGLAGDGVDVGGVRRRVGVPSGSSTLKSRRSSDAGALGRAPPPLPRRLASNSRSGTCSGRSRRSRPAYTPLALLRSPAFLCGARDGTRSLVLRGRLGATEDVTFLLCGRLLRDEEA